MNEARVRYQVSGIRGEVSGVTCPHCKRNDMTEPFARVTEKIMEWFCYRCGLAWNVADWSVDEAVKDRCVMFAVNMKVNTPLGQGIVWGGYGVLDANRELITTGILVRLPINEITRPTMRQSYCITPKAVGSGLWVFNEGELK